MRITQEADYGLRVVLYLSNRGYGEKVEAKVISEDEKIPLRFLLKLLRKLNAGGITKSYRGVNGGYALNKYPKEITLKDVIEAIDGPICVNKCIGNPEACNAGKVGKCAVHRAMCGVQRKLIEELEKVDFEKVINDHRLAKDIIK